MQAQEQTPEAKATPEAKGTSAVESIPEAKGKSARKAANPWDESIWEEEMEQDAKRTKMTTFWRIKRFQAFSDFRQ